MPYSFRVGRKYETQAGQTVKIVRRHDKYRGYETVLGDDDIWRYDRSTHNEDAGRVCGSDHNYSDSRNFKRPVGVFFELPDEIRDRIQTEYQTYLDGDYADSGCVRPNLEQFAIDVIKLYHAGTTNQ